MPTPNHIFFYGTLRQNELNHKIIKKDKRISFLGNVATKNKYSFIMINRTRMYPFITEATYKGHKKVNVIGDLYEINPEDRKSFIYDMDHFENRYKRKIIQVVDKTGNFINAYTYFIKDKWIKHLNDFLKPNGLEEFIFIDSGSYV